jgi:Transposase IS66 family
LLPRHPMAEAINYALGQWQELNVFCTDGAVPIDNNVSEREMKRVVLNRKNSLFVGNPRGGKRSRSCPALRAPAVGMTSIHNSISPSCWSIFPRNPSANYARGYRISGRAVTPHIFMVFRIRPPRPHRNVHMDDIYSPQQDCGFRSFQTKESHFQHCGSDSIILINSV